MRIGIITGASSGMGKEFVKLVLSEQLRLDEIWVIARRQDRLEAWQKHYPDENFRTLALDLASRDDIKSLQEELAESGAQIALFIHCAGFGIMGRIDEIPVEEQLEMVDLNCRSVVELTTTILPHMEKGGRMIYVASAAAFLPQPGFAVYSATKAFVLSFVRSLRAECREENYDITVVCPGAVRTEFFKRAAEKKHLPAYKKMVMADPKKVVKKAWKDSLAGRELSVYGKPMKLFHTASKVLPHKLFLHFMGRQKS